MFFIIYFYLSIAFYSEVGGRDFEVRGIMVKRYMSREED